MPPGDDNDQVILDRGTGEEAKMCKKDDLANSPGTSQPANDLPVSQMSTPMNSGTQMDPRSRDFLNALTGQTTVPVKTITFENERSFDEQLRPQLRANVKKIQEKNREWWNKLHLDNFYPLFEAHPYDTPNTYANLAFKLQRIFNNTGLSARYFKRQIDEDGIFARESLAILYDLASKYPGNKKDIPNEPLLHDLVQNLSAQLATLLSNEDFRDLVRELQEHLLTVMVKPEVIVRWSYDVPMTSLLEFFRYNYTKKGAIQSGIYFDTSFYPIIRVLCQNDQEAEHIAEVLTLDQKFEMLGTLYMGQSVNVSAVYFQVARDFTHYEDLQEVNPNKNYKELSLNFMLNNGEYVDEVEAILKIKFPNWALVAKTRERSKQFGQLPQDANDAKDKPPAKAQPAGPLIISLALFHYLPKFTPQQKAAAKALIDAYVLATDSINQESLNFLKRIEADVILRKTQPADITNYQDLMDVLTFYVGSKGSPTAGSMVLMERAQNTYFLTVKMEEKSDISILTLRQILASNEQAQRNDSYPIFIGEFKAPPNSPYRQDNSNLRAQREEDGVRVFCKGFNQPFNERVYKFMEPVKVTIGVLDPDVGTATEFYRDTFTERVWQVESQWHLSDALPQAIPIIRENLDDALAMKGLDIIITTLTLAFSFAGAMLSATGTTLLGGIGAKAIVPLTRGLLKAVFWFILTEALMAKFMAFDHEINTDKEKYSDDDRDIWNTFKVGLLIFGGIMLLRQAWKGLKFAGSKIFASTLSELELELLKKSTMKALPLEGTLSRMLSAKTTALTISKQWAKEALALTASTLRDLTEEAVTRLKQLPPWALNIIKELKDEVIRKLFGCASFCKVDLTAIKNGLIELVVGKLKIDKIVGILAFEKEMLKNLSFEAWDRIVKYAVRNRNYFSVKGKIAEELFMMKPEFRTIFNEAIAEAGRKGILPADMEFVNYIRGWAPTGMKAIKPGYWAELTDGMIVGIKRNVGGVAGKDELHILAVFESKSPSNMEHLTKGKWGEYNGQLAKDFERIRQNSIKIIINGEEKEFAPGAVRISRNTTQWVGVLPPGYSLPDDLVTRLRGAIPDARLITGPVRNEILNDLAKSLKSIINYQPRPPKVIP